MGGSGSGDDCINVYLSSVDDVSTTPDIKDLSSFSFANAYRSSLLKGLACLSSSSLCETWGFLTGEL